MLCYRELQVRAEQAAYSATSPSKMHGSATDLVLDESALAVVISAPAPAAPLLSPRRIAESKGLLVDIAATPNFEQVGTRGSDH